MRILLIAGHGAGDPGAVSGIRGTQYREADETRKLVPMIAGALAGYAEVSIYDTERNAYGDYKAGTLNALARFEQYDYVLEVHFNAFAADDGDGATKGCECYVTTGETGTTVEEQICSNLASLGLHSRGVKKKDYSVIAMAKKAGASSALLEVCFLDDADDMAIYTEKREEAAALIAAAIVSEFGLSAGKKEDAAMSVKLQQYGVRFEDIDHIAYIPMAGTKGETVSAAAVRKTWNGRCPDVICNAELFDRTAYTPASGVVAGGEAQYLPPVHGAALVGGKRPVLSYQNNLKASDWIGAYPMLVRDGKQAFDSVPAGLTGKRARICLAWNDKQAAVLYVKAADGCMLEKFASAVIAAGYDTAINLDGGGSVACITPGVVYDQGRSVRGKIGIWVKGGTGNLLAQKQATTSTTTSASAPSASKMSPMAQDKTKVTGVTLRVTANSGLRLRRSAPDGETIRVYAKGAAVTWYGYFTVQLATGAKWLYVRAADGNQGYMSADCLAEE